MSCLAILLILKLTYSEKATNFCEISTVDLSYVITVKSMGDIFQNFVAFSEHMGLQVSLKSHLDILTTTISGDIFVLSNIRKNLNTTLKLWSFLSLIVQIFTR